MDDLGDGLRPDDLLDGGGIGEVPDHERDPCHFLGLHNEMEPSQVGRTIECDDPLATTS
jgi:hypothetical protein